MIIDKVWHIRMADAVPAPTNRGIIEMKVSYEVDDQLAEQTTPEVALGVDGDVIGATIVHDGKDVEFPLSIAAPKEDNIYSEPAWVISCAFALVDCGRDTPNDRRVADIVARELWGKYADELEPEVIATLGSTDDDTPYRYCRITLVDEYDDNVIADYTPCG